MQIPHLRRPECRNRWFSDYITQTVERDAVELSRVRDRRLLHENYIRLLEDLYLVRRLPAWGTALRAKTIKAPKIHMMDSGVAAHLMGITPSKLAATNPAALTEFGHLLETFTFGEIAKQVSWMLEVPALGHWRTSRG